MGPGSALADYCYEYYLNKGTYVQTLKLYHTPGEGIVGSIWIMNDGSYKLTGQIVGSDRTYKFSKDHQLIGFESIMENRLISSASILTVFKDPSLCKPPSTSDIQVEEVTSEQSSVTYRYVVKSDKNTTTVILLTVIITLSVMCVVHSVLILVISRCFRKGKKLNQIKKPKKIPERRCDLLKYDQRLEHESFL